VLITAKDLAKCQQELTPGPKRDFFFQPASC